MQAEGGGRPLLPRPSPLIMRGGGRERRGGECRKRGIVPGDGVDNAGRCRVVIAQVPATAAVALRLGIFRLAVSPGGGIFRLAAGVMERWGVDQGRLEVDAGGGWRWRRGDGRGTSFVARGGWTVQEEPRSRTWRTLSHCGEQEGQELRFW